MMVSENYISALRPEVTKRVWLDELFPKIEKHAKGASLLKDVAKALADQTSFPDLMGHEDTVKFLREANEAVGALKDYLARKKKETDSETEAAERRKAGKDKQQTVIRSHADLEILRNRFDKLCLEIGTQKAGYNFQHWFYDLMDYFEVRTRRPYVTEGRQIDGSIDIEGTSYLIELKFTAEQSGEPPHVWRTLS